MFRVGKNIASGYSTDYGYNAFDLVASITLPEDYDPAAGNQNQTAISYCRDGLTRTVMDAHGHLTQYIYDGYRRLVAVEYADGSMEQYSYDVRGLLIEEIKRDGTTIYYNYDAIGRLIGKGTSQNGVIGTNSIANDYFASGSWTAVEDADCVSGRYAVSTDPNAAYSLWVSDLTEGSYAASIRYPQIDFASVNAEITVYHGENETSFYLDQSTGGDLWVYLGAFDFTGGASVVIKSNGSTDFTSIDAVRLVPLKRFEYDINGRLIKTENYEFNYDRAGRLISQTDLYNRTVGYEYTPAGRKSKLIYPDGYYVNYGYDSVGRLNSISDSRGKVLWSCSYDAAGRRTQTTGLYGLTTVYDYEDVAGNDNRGLYLDGLTHTLDTETIYFEYERDLSGNITTKLTKDTKFDYLYDKNYSLTSVVFEDDSELIFTYDNLFNRVAVEYGLDTTNYSLFENGLNQYSQVDAIALEYDLNGNLVQHGTRHYLYDSENQLLATYNLAGEPNETQVSLYSYDEFGRRVSKAVATGVSSTSGATTESYLYDGFQAIGEYDESGEYIRRRFIYAAGIDEPIAMVTEPAHQGFFGFDEFSDFAVSWLYDSNDIGFNANADLNFDGVIDLDDLKLFASDFYLDERPLLESPKYYGYVFDGLGSVVALSYCNDPNQTGDPNETAYLIETYTYDSFGTPTIRDAEGIELNSSAVSNPYMFTARRYDGESGLYYYRFRMYDAELGRFLQTDPIGYYDSMNLYQYCLNNPTNYIDPWGLYDLRIHPPSGGGTISDPYIITYQDIMDTIQTQLNQLGDNSFFSVYTVEFDNPYFHKEQNQSQFCIKGEGNQLFTGHDINYMLVGARAGHNGVPLVVAQLVRGGYSWVQNRRQTSENEYYFFNLGFVIGRILDEN